MEHDGQVVYLDIWPYYTDEDFHNSDSDGFPDPKHFSVLGTPYDDTSGGVSYNIKASESDDLYFDDRNTSRRIYGYFKILGIQGPQMGFMTVSMKPVNIENALLLKK